MTFFDWIGFSASGVQSFFAWATFNRDGFVDNVMFRQNQMYQQKNYQISWIAIARDDIRDMMSISVNRINNYMIVATLILSVAAGAVMSVSFDDETPDYLCYSFYLSTSISIIYLMLAIMFGVKGQNCAFTNTMKLLTCKIRPENPADYNHDYMKQAQWVERGGISKLFRMPGMNPYYDTVHEDLVAEGKHPHSSSVFDAIDHGDGKGPGMKGNTSSPQVNLEADTPLESLVTRSSHLWYLTKFGRFMKLWLPYDTYSKYSMGLGIICLGQGSAYFSLGKLLAEGQHFTYWAACAMTFAFIYMVVLVTTQNFKAKSMRVRFVVYVLLAAGPLLSSLAAVTQDIWVDRFAVPLSYFSHFVFWLFAFLLAQRSEEMNGEEKLDWLNSPFRKDANQKYKYQQEGAPGQLAVAAPAVARPAPRWSHGGAVGTTHRGGHSDQQGTAEEWRAAQQMQQRPCGGVGDGNGVALGAQPDFDDDAAADHWPTDDMEFDDRADKTSYHIKRSVRHTLVASSVMWFAMFIWSIAKYAIEIPAQYQAAVGKVHTPVGVQDISAVWPSPLFRPHAVACANGVAFLADRFSIFNHSGNGKMERVQCPLSRTISDVAAFCDGSGCRPLALVYGGGRSPEVIDCGTGEAMPLLLDGSSAELLAVRSTTSQSDLKSQRLIAAQSSGELVQYAWSSSRRGWEPEWFLGKAELLPENLVRPRSRINQIQAISTASSASGVDIRLLIFRGDVDVSTSLPSVEARSLDTMEREDAWSSPPSLGTIASGCSVDAGFSALALPDFGASPDGPAPSLVRLNLA